MNSSLSADALSAEPGDDAKPSADTALSGVIPADVTARLGETTTLLHPGGEDADGEPADEGAFSQESLSQEALSQEALNEEAGGEETVSGGETAGGSLSQRAKSSSLWTTSGTIIGQILSVLSLLVVGRLLSKEQFGLYAMALTVNSGLSVLFNVSLDSSFIANAFNSPAELKTYLSTIWTAELLRRVVLSIALVIAAYPASLLFHEPRLVPVLCVLALAPAIGGLSTPGLMLLRREVRFGRVFAFDTIKNLIANGVTIVFACLHPSVWALVAGEVGGSLGSVLLSYLLHSFRPRPMLDRGVLRKAFNFGIHTFIISMMWFATTNADNWFVAAMLGTGAIGLYQMAYQIAMKPGNALGGTVGNVMFPVFAELARGGETERLERTVLRIFGLFAALLVVVFTPFMLLPSELLSIIGTKWLPAAPLLVVLSVIGFVNAILLMLYPLLMGMNKPQLESRAKVIEAITFIVLLGPMVYWLGVMGAAWAGVIVHIQACVLRWNYVRDLLPHTSRRLPRVFGVAFAGGAGGAALTWGVLAVLKMHGLTALPARFWVGAPLCVVSTLALLLWWVPTLSAELQGLLSGIRRRFGSAG